MKSYNDLRTQLERLQAQLEEVTAKERANAISEIKAKMQNYGIEASELETARKKRVKAAPARARTKKKIAVAKTASAAAKKSHKPATAMQEVRYRDPISGATWSGRGRPPRWLDGKEREKFAVKH